MAFIHTAGSNGRYAYTDTTGNKWAFIIKRHCIVIKRNVCFVECFLCFFTGKVLVTQVNQHQMVVGAIANEVIAAFNKRSSHSLGIPDNLFAVRLELIGEYLPKGNGFSSNNMLQRSTLHTGENGQVEQGAHGADVTFRVFNAHRVIKIMTHHDDTTAGTA